MLREPMRLLDLATILDDTINTTCQGGVVIGAGKGGEKFVPVRVVIRASHGL